MNTAETHGKPGHNSGGEFGLAIDAFVGEARIEEALLREEISRFPEWQRLLLIKNGMALGLVRLCRMQPRMDCTGVLYSLVCLLSDNNGGFCWLSQRRFAELLARSPTTVSEAFGRLLKCQAIQMVPGNGRKRSSSDRRQAGSETSDCQGSCNRRH